MQKYLILLIIATTLGACSSKDKKEEHANINAEMLYNDAMDLMDEGRYRPAVEKFEQLEREFPFSRWATRAEIMTAYGYYKQEDYDDAIPALDRFIKLHPGNKDVSYAYYLKALSYYERIADIRRDQDITKLAKGTLREVVARFPESDYARDAQLKLDLVEDHLAGKEIEIGRYYIKKGNVLAAINRYKRVVEKFKTTNHTAEALYRLTEAYVALGVFAEAQKYAAVLGHNYPESKWYKLSYDLLRSNTPLSLVETEYNEKQNTLVNKTLKTIGIKN